MDSERARELISIYVKEEFGKVLELREVNVARSSSGRIWMGSLYCVTAQGDIEVGSVSVNEDGRIIGGVTADILIGALSQIGSARESLKPPEDSEQPEPMAAEDDFSEVAELKDELAFGGEDDELDGFDVIDDFFADLDHSDLRSQIIGLLSSGKEEDLLQARELMPQLLVDPDQRGSVLRQMGELELRLGNIGDGLNYLEAAAREFADLASIKSLEHVAEMTARVVSESAFDTHPIKVLLDQTHARMEPVTNLEQVPAFTGLSAEEMFELTGAAEQIKVDEGNEILVEGAPAVLAFVIKSGILSVRLEAPDGGSRIVRCCYPGEFIGESSVLEERGATCNATVTAECETTLWRFWGEQLRELVGEHSSLRERIDAARKVHQLDSFFSMNRATGNLDARVRDRILGCIRAFRHVDASEILGEEGSVPPAVYLIIEGRIEYKRAGNVLRAYDTDAFVGLSDTLHELPLEGDLVAAAPCRLIVFDQTGLKTFAADAPPDVVAVLERLD